MTTEAGMIEQAIADIAADRDAADGWPIGTNTERPDPPPDTWRPVDLGPYLRGEIKPVEPNVGMWRSDGLQLLYPGKEHSIMGEMESGKSWFCLAHVAHELAEGRHVMYVHFEESDPADTIERLRLLGATDTELLDRFRFVGPMYPAHDGAIARLVDPPPSLAVLDGVNEGMLLHAWKVRDEDGAAAFRRRIIRPFIAAGAATLAADHVVKDRENRGRSPLGSIHKGNALNGALFLLENADPFGRGQRGRSHLYVTKDRPGYLRRRGRPTKLSGRTFLGELVVDDTQVRDPDLHLHLWAPAEEKPASPDATAGAATLADAVLAVLGSQPDGAIGSERQLLAAMREAGHKGRNTAVKDALDDLVYARKVEPFTAGQGKGYRLPASRTASPGTGNGESNASV